MPSKTEEYLALAQRTANGLTRYWESWTDYLTTASRLYKYPFADQLMIYAQRPDATACAEFDIWRNRMNRYVRRGAKGIALLDESSGFPRLHYVFDVSDTGVRRNSRDPEVWQYNDDLKQPVSEMLAATYGISGERVSQQLADVAGKLVADYWDNNGGDIRAIVDGSLLMDYDEAGVEMQFKSAAAISVTYTLLERCGFEPTAWFDKDDFRAIHEFSTPDAVFALGAAVSDMSREVLRNIERTVKTTIRRRNNERSQHEYEQQSELHADRGLSSPEPDPASAEDPAGQVRQAAPDVPDEPSPGAVQHDAPEREPVPAPDGGGADGKEPDAADHGAASETEPGSGQGAESDGVGAAHEQPESASRGTGADGADLQLSFFDAHIPTEAEQIGKIDQAESEKLPSAFVLSQAEIENELRKHGSGFMGGKQRIMALYQTQPDRNLRAKALAKEYGVGGHSHDFLDGSRGFVNHDWKGLEFDHYPDHQKITLKWTQVEKYIDLMIQSDRYLTDREKEHYTPPAPVNAEPDVELARAKNLIREFCQEEYDSEPDFSNLSKIGVAYTNATDEEIPIQVNVDLVGYRVERYLGEVLIDERQYESLEDLTETELEALDFSELVSVTDEELEHYHSKAEERPALLPLDAAAEYNALKEQYPDALVGFEQNGYYEFYGEDARKVCELLGGKLLEKETALGTVPVTGFPSNQWVYRAKQLWQRGENVYLAGLNEDGTHHQTKYLRREDYLPLDATVHMEGRAFRVDTVNYDRGSVTLQDVALAEMRMPIFREEPLAVVRELYEQEQEVMESPLPDYKVGDNVVVELPTRTIEGKVGYVGETDVRIDTSAHGQSWDNEVVNKQQFEEGLRQNEQVTTQPDDTVKTVAIYPAEENRMPYDIVIQTIGSKSPALDAVEPERSTLELAGNFHITDDDLGVGGPKQKFARNIEAIRTLFKLEEEHRGATAEEQQVLSQYVGWGGLADAFDPDKDNWAKEYAELKGLLSEDEYAAARSSTLNAHYTSPVVIRSIYDAVEKMGFQSGNILEPSMGVGNFFGMLPDTMQDSRLYGVELDSIPYYLRHAVKVRYSPYTAEWRVEGKTATGRGDIISSETYGTSRANAYKILEETLNLKDVRIYDTIEDAEGKPKRVLNKRETMLAQQKQQVIKDAFANWVWQDPQRRIALVKQYNELFNSTRPREYDGSHIHFVGMNPEITLREHQRNAIAHVLYGGNTLLAHEVGAGKTYEMAASAMEAKRLGLCQKSLFVVPNHLTEQWASEFLNLYPNAKLLVARRKDFETANRKKFCARIATGDYDAVIIGHSQFERIPLSFERQERIIQEQIYETLAAINELKVHAGENFSIKQMEKTRKTLETKLEKLRSDERKDDVITFEQLGVDRLFVDESHAFKNLFLTTKMRNVAGLSTSEAQKSSDMFGKCRYLDEITGGRGVVFATGTPVSNSMTELYTVMRYLQYSTLQQKKLTHFDCWASTFGETTTAIELAPEGTGYRARTRFAKFFNLPELMSMFKEVADIKTSDQLHLPVPEAKFETVVAKPSEIQKEMVQELSKRAARIHSGTVDASEDNMLCVTNDGRKIGLDVRLMNPMLPDDPNSKLNVCVQNVLKIWEEGKDQKLTQLLFCDLSTPKNDGNFNVYDDIRKKLVAAGVPENEIEFIHNADTEAKKAALFSKVRSGDVRVLLGSTAKMGAGTNVQSRLVAVHHLDVGWKPSDMTQRNGRIIRQGNMNKEVKVFNYVTEGTFDSYLYQTLENKQRFISQIMTSKSPVRSCEDVDEQALSYAEIKALCAGNPLIKEKMDLDVQVAKLKVLKADHQSQKFRLQDKLLTKFPADIQETNAYIAGVKADAQLAAAHPQVQEGFCGMTIKGVAYDEKKTAGERLFLACSELPNAEEKVIGSYRGFELSLRFDTFRSEYQALLKGQRKYTVPLGTDPLGNIIRLDNSLNNFPERITAAENELDTLHQQQAAAQIEVEKPFPQEEELAEKSARLAELNAQLDVDEKSHEPEQDEEEQEDAPRRPSVLAALEEKSDKPEPVKPFRSYYDKDGDAR